MPDLIGELARLLIVGALLVYHSVVGRNRAGRQERGWWFVSVGLALAMLGAFARLARHIGLLQESPLGSYAPRYPLFLETLGVACGYALAAIGVMQWLRAMKSLREARRAVQSSCQEPESQLDKRAALQVALDEELKREIARRKRSEEQLRRHRDRLEELAQERTRTLQETNSRLQQQIAEREWAEDELASKARELSRSNDFIAALSRVAAQLEATWDLEEVMETLGTELKALHVNCLIGLVEPDSRDLVVCYSSIDSAALAVAEKLPGVTLRGHRIAQDIWSSFRTLELGRTIFVNDPAPLSASVAPGGPKTLVERAIPVPGLSLNAPTVYLPLIAREETIGLLAVWGAHLRQDDVPTLSIFAAQVANAIQSARLYAAERQRSTQLARTSEQLRTELADRLRAEEALQRRTEQQEQLVKTARHLTESLDLREVLTRIATEAREILRAHGCAIYMLESDAKTLTPVVSIDPPYEEQILATTLNVDSSFTGQAVLARRGMIFNDAGVNPVGQQIPGTPLSEDERVMAAPFVVDDEILGAMCLNRPETLFTDEDLALAETFATYAAYALKNAQAHRDLQREAEEHRLARVALRESEERFREMAKTIQAVFWVAKPDLSEFLYVSPAFERIYGRSCQSLYEDASLWSEAIHPQDRELVLAALEARRGADQETTYRIHQPDGSVRWILDSVFPVSDSRGEPLRLIGFAEDITERRSLEEQLRQSQKMEAVGQLAGGVAHDFNNLLTVINGYSEMLLDSSDHTESMRPELELIHRAGERAAELTRQLLAFSRRQTVELQVLDLNQVLEETSRMLRRIIGEDIRLSLELGPQLGLIRADRGQIEQVLVNLAANARDAMPTGGTLTIATANVQVGARHLATHLQTRPGPHVLLAVRDGGIGMRDEVSEHLFEPFFTTKEVDKGTGLGLAMLYGLVKEFGGGIDVLTSPGQGTIFNIYLPQVERAAEAYPEEVCRAPLPTGTETILLVEDQEDVLSYVASSLRRLGYTVLQANTTDEAVHLAQQGERSIDLILADVIMPWMNGPELVERLRADRKELPALYMSGYDDEAINHRAPRPPDDPFMGKPLTLARIARYVRDAIDGRIKP